MAILTTNAAFKEITYYIPDEGDQKPIFSFLFEQDIVVQPFDFWRITQEGKIVLVSFDHGHKFGLPQPIDIAEEVTKLLKGASLMELRRNEQSGDLTLLLSNNIKVEIYITSMGYESYYFYFNGSKYYALGGGDIAIF